MKGEGSTVSKIQKSGAAIAMAAPLFALILLPALTSAGIISSQPDHSADSSVIESSADCITLTATSTRNLGDLTLYFGTNTFSNINPSIATPNWIARVALYSSLDCTAGNTAYVMYKDSYQPTADNTVHTFDASLGFWDATFASYRGYGSQAVSTSTPSFANARSLAFWVARATTPTFSSNGGYPCGGSCAPYLQGNGTTTAYILEDDGPTATTTPTCTENCNSNVLFLPGIEASRLYDAGNNEVWLPANDDVAETLVMDADGNSLNPDITTFDALEETHAPQLFHNVYKSFLNDMQTWQTTYGIIATTTPYDWRLGYETLLTNGRKLPNGHISYLQTPEVGHDPYIIETLKQLASSSPTHKVTIIAHSNGGLLAKALMIKLGATTTAQLIDKVIMVDVPQVGTPQAVGALLHGYDQSLSSYIFGTSLSDVEARKLAQNMPMAYNLLPTDAYFTYTDDPVITFDPASMPDWRSHYSDQLNLDAGIHSVELLKNFMTDSSDFRSKPVMTDTATPEVVNSTLYDNGMSLRASLDTWAPPSGVQLFTVAGWGNETLSGIKYMRKIDGCLLTSTNGCAVPSYSDQVTYQPQTVIDGDGTVVESSQHWAGGASSTRYWVNLKDYNRFVPQTFLPLLGTSHNNILEIPEVRNLLSGIEKDGVNALLPDTYVTTYRPSYDGSVPRLHFVLHSPLTLGFVDTQGNYTGSTATTTVFSINGVDYRRFGEVQWLSVPKSLAGQVVMHGTASGSFTLDIEDVNGNDILATTTFAAVPSATSTVATIVIDPSQSPATNSTLLIDFNGDGVTDDSLQSRAGGAVIPYRFAGFIQPINDTAHQIGQNRSVFKCGSTIPVKFQLKKVDGTVIQAASLPTWITPQKGSIMASSTNETVYTDGGSSGTTYSWQTDHYQYNWSTKNLSCGYWYRIGAQFDDGTTQFVIVGLR